MRFPKHKASRSKLGIVLLLSASAVVVCAQSVPPGTEISLADDHSPSLQFEGPPSARLFTRELKDSFNGVLEKNFIAVAHDGLPAGFVRASPLGQPWADTMWTRDSGTFMRELTLRGYYQHASLVAECLMHLVQKNHDGFYAFPRFFRAGAPGSGTEVDGTASIVIALSLLWQRLPPGNQTRDDIQHFLLQPSSPLNYFDSLLKDHPLVAGTGEFGCGMRIPGECYNVVQNNLAMLALLASSNLAEQSGDHNSADEFHALAIKISNAMEHYLVAPDGSWLWCIDTSTLRPNPAVLNAGVNRGFGGTNGVGSMDADVLGLQPSDSQWQAIARNRQTLTTLYSAPLRREQFNKYGIWPQFDVIGGGYLTSPSYGQGYALQEMLLDDDFGMARSAIDFLVNATYQPLAAYQLHRDSPYFFYERMYSPDAAGKTSLDAGCGQLNLVNVSEPLKVSRLILGVDDSSPTTTSLIPRLPAGWTRVEAINWPVRTSHGIVRASIRFDQKQGHATFSIHLQHGQQIDDLRVRLPTTNGFVWRDQKNVSNAHFSSP